ncbi:MAG: OmpA family protein [Rhodospirillales bacterium]|nr:OmpA family protein [Rhodospirillales bacterium]
MRPIARLALATAALFAAAGGGAAHAQAPSPSADQIARALSQPAVRITPSMLQGPTRGIVPAGPTAAPARGTTQGAGVVTAAAAPAGVSAGRAPASAADPCPAGSGTCALTIEFQTGSASLTPRAVAVLDNLGKALASLQEAGFRFRLEGHTDTVGTEAYNQTLSEQRAETVAVYLARHYGLDPARLLPVGMGKDHPLVVTPDQTPEARNRRVQVVNLGA